MMEVNPNDTAVVITDPQNDFLSPRHDGYQEGLQCLSKICQV